MATTTKHTKSSVTALARRHLGKDVEVRFNRTGTSPERRAECRKRMDEILTRNDELLEQIDATPVQWGRLLKAAEFVCDVDAEEPSLGQLREAVKSVKEHEMLRDELTENKREWERLRDAALFWRIQVTVYRHAPYLGRVGEVICSCDSWDEAATAIERKSGHAAD